MIRVYMPLVDGGQQLHDEYSSGKALIEDLISDDFEADPNCLCIEAKDRNGKTVTLTIPYGDRDTVSVKIE